MKHLLIALGLLLTNIPAFAGNWLPSIGSNTSGFVTVQAWGVNAVPGYGTSLTVEVEASGGADGFGGCSANGYLQGTLIFTWVPGPGQTLATDPPPSILTLTEADYSESKGTGYNLLYVSSQAWDNWIVNGNTTFQEPTYYIGAFSQSVAETTQQFSYPASSGVASINFNLGSNATGGNPNIGEGAQFTCDSYLLFETF